jgi:hypothetical protein
MPLWKQSLKLTVLLPQVMRKDHSITYRCSISNQIISRHRPQYTRAITQYYHCVPDALRLDESENIPSLINHFIGKQANEWQ